MKIERDSEKEEVNRKNGLHDMQLVQKPKIQSEWKCREQRSGSTCTLKLKWIRGRVRRAMQDRELLRRYVSREIAVMAEERGGLAT